MMINFFINVLIDMYIVFRHNAIAHLIVYKHNFIGSGKSKKSCDSLYYNIHFSLLF